MPKSHVSWFGRAARSVSGAAGHPLAFAIALGVVVVWAVAGPFFGFGNGWQLAINSTTTIVTFLMVFLIQNAQNRDSTAMQLKLDELIRATKGTHNALLDIEELSQPELEKMRAHYEELATRARKALRRGKPDTDAPDFDRAARLSG
jgi:low affinity Fe/Cu permease